MKTIIKMLAGLASGCVVACCLFLFNTRAFAIEGLAISVPSTNVVLSWPSETNETYLIQYRHTLNATDSWTTLADSYPPNHTGLNITHFYDTNVDYGSGGSGGGGSMMMASQSSTSSSTSIKSMTPTQRAQWLSEIISNIMPPTITGTTTRTALRNSPQTPQPQGGSGGGSINTAIPGTGFYRVVRDGVHIFGLTNGAVLSGTVQFPIEMGLTRTDEVVGVAFYDENNNPIVGATGDGSGDHWALTWNTLATGNGTYNLYAEVDYSSDTPAVSVPISVTVSNVISFPNYFSEFFGGQMWVYAETIPNAAYTLDMYDENTNYIGTFAGNADANGVISFLWNLIDPNGSPDTNTNFLGVYTVNTSSLTMLSAQNLQTVPPTQKTIGTKAKPNSPQPNGGSSKASATNAWAMEPSWYPTPNWAIAYSPLSPNDPVTTLEIEKMMIGGDGGAYGGVVSTIGNYGLGAPMSPGNVSQSSAFEMADTNSRAQFLGYMAQSPYRQFYFFGHGGPSGFGTTGAVITSRDVQNDLGNFMHTAKPILNHPYRLVFVDGCLAGSGTLCENFGIPAVTVNTNYFLTMGVWSRSFLGFQKKVSFNPQQWTWRALMLGGFFDDWMQRNTLQFCVTNAQAGAHSSGQQPMDSTAVIFGAVDLRKDMP